ncbi:MAG TPA: winged helix-turn-helix transcriptional regulator [Polyangiaceae bacterium]|jgi:DNA-binding HxlR family transcriptional regulator|nr:winged helix-turn-helix transcriptional regulator [Polyangiaceae bacterium]
MTKARRYDEPCGIARALDRVGERWALLVARELLFGPKRFTDLREGLPTASPNVLSQRLDELVEDGVVQRRQLDPPARVWVYELTAWGRQLGPVLTALGRWGSRATPTPRGDLSSSALLVALQTTYEPRRANAAPLAIELKLGDARYWVRMEDGAIDIASGAATKPDATLETDSATLRRVVFGDLSLADAQERGLLRVDGSARAAARFVESFRRPVPIAPSESVPHR